MSFFSLFGNIIYLSFAVYLALTGGALAADVIRR